MNCPSDHVETDPRDWMSFTSIRRTFNTVLRRSESPMNVQPSNRLSRNSARIMIARAASSSSVEGRQAKAGPLS